MPSRQHNTNTNVDHQQKNRHILARVFLRKGKDRIEEKEILERLKEVQESNRRADEANKQLKETNEKILEKLRQLEVSDANKEKVENNTNLDEDQQKTNYNQDSQLAGSKSFLGANRSGEEIVPLEALVPLPVPSEVTVSYLNLNNSNLETKFTETARSLHPQSSPKRSGAYARRLRRYQLLKSDEESSSKKVKQKKHFI